MIRIRKRYYVVWVVKENASYSFLRRRRINPTTKSVKYSEHRHDLRIDYPTYSRGNRLFYFVELSEGQIFFHDLGIDYDPELIHEFVDRKILQQLASNLTSNQWKMNIVLAIFSGVFGGLVGWIVAGA